MPPGLAIERPEGTRWSPPHLPLQSRAIEQRHRERHGNAALVQTATVTGHHNVTTQIAGSGNVVR
jgi:hypothetical protein